MQSEGDSGWIQAWRVFYWAWWLSWAPFVGIFIARITRGRTIREFIFGVMIIPTLVSILWFTVFGGLTLNVTDQFSSKQLAVMSAHPETALFHIFDQHPLGLLLSLIALMLLVTFFITSANSATFVLGMLTSHGELDPPAGKKTFWGILIAVVAFALILSGSIEMIQTISIVIAFPYDSAGSGLLSYLDLRRLHSAGGRVRGDRSILLHFYGSAPMQRQPRGSVLDNGMIL